MRRVNPNTRHFYEGIARFLRVGCFGRLDTLFRIGSIFSSRLHNKAPGLTQYFGDGTENNRRCCKAQFCMPMATRGQGRMLLYPEDHREYELIPVTGAQCAAIVPGLASSLAQRARGRAS